MYLYYWKPFVIVEGGGRKIGENKALTGKKNRFVIKYLFCTIFFKVLLVFLHLFHCKANMLLSYEWVILSEWFGVLRHFRQFFSHIVTVFACDRYYGCYHIALPQWSTVPQTTRTQIPHPVTLSWHQANQSYFYPLNAERLARKHLVPIFMSLVWPGRGFIKKSIRYMYIPSN